MKATLITLTFAVFLLCPRLVAACSCGGTTSVSGSFAAAEAVLVGTVTRVENTTTNDDGVISSEEPFPLGYFPGVFEKEKATVLTFVSGDRLQDFDIHIPSQRPTKTIQGRLLFSDGRPVDAESVEFVSEEKPDQKQDEVRAKTDAEGRFSLRVLEGLKGTLHGYIYSISGQYENCPKLDALIRAHKDIETKKLKLEIDRDHDNLELVFPFPHCAKAKQKP